MSIVMLRIFKYFKKISLHSVHSASLLCLEGLTELFIECKEEPAFEFDIQAVYKTLQKRRDQCLSEREKGLL